MNPIPEEKFNQFVKKALEKCGQYPIRFVVRWKKTSDQDFKVFFERGRTNDQLALECEPGEQKSKGDRGMGYATERLTAYIKEYSEMSKFTASAENANKESFDIEIFVYIFPCCQSCSTLLTAFKREVKQTESVKIKIIFFGIYNQGNVTKNQLTALGEAKVELLAAEEKDWMIVFSEYMKKSNLWKMIEKRKKAFIDLHKQLQQLMLK